MYGAPFYRKYTSPGNYAKVYSQPLRGKTVALVGPAGYVETAGVDRFVKAADVVVRPNVRTKNNSRLLLPHNVTRRVDVVYHSGAVLGEPLAEGATSATTALAPATLASYRAAGVSRVIVVATPKEDAGRVRNLAQLAAASRKYRKPELLLAPAPDDARLRTGVQAFLDVHRQQPSVLCVFGFTFYSADSAIAFPGYYDGITRVAPDRAANHNTGAELALFARHFVGNAGPCVLVDRHVADVLVNARAVPATGLAELTCPAGQRVGAGRSSASLWCAKRAARRCTAQGWERVCDLPVKHQKEPQNVHKTRYYRPEFDDFKAP